MMAPVPSTSGIPAAANSKKPKPPSPASSAAFDMSTFTGEPTSVNTPPALAENASGMAIREIGMPTRIAATTATGSSAATAPMKLIAAVNSTQTSMMRTSNRVRLAPAFSIKTCPAQVVTPAASRPVLMTNSVAMKITTGSPSPANAAPASSTPV